MFDPTKPVQTRDGKFARILTTNLSGRLPIVAAVDYGTYEKVYCYHEDGTHPQFGEDNLVNSPEGFDISITIYKEKRTGFLKVRAAKRDEKDGKFWSDELGPDKKAADIIARKTIRIREGEGLE